MRAVVYAGEGAVRVDEVPRPTLQDPRDAIVKVSRSSICGSDLHLLNGKTPGMREGGIIGHEFVGNVFEFGEGVRNLHQDGRVLGSFLIACGRCSQCALERFNHCKDRRALGLGPLTGDLDGAQAEYVRVPNADMNLKPLTGVFSALSDEQALFGGDILTTGFYAAALSQIKKDQTVVVVGAGPVGMFSFVAAMSARPGKVLLLDTDPKRVDFLGSAAGIDVLLIEDEAQAGNAVAERTNGEMADVVIDAVGSVAAFKTALRCVREGGRVTVVGVYGTERYDLPLGKVWLRGIDIRFAGMANIHRHWEDALLSVAKGGFDPTALITHRMPLEEAEKGYELFAARDAMKVVLTH
ncbi:MAG TPA: alcohol dehydrogenase catalytic domain-containing protein [Actinomycetota bacterium]|nr:alcohol dehydrogenase catalytic domain-containing protein [Actinomycetota bacterium]